MRRRLSRAAGPALAAGIATLLIVVVPASAQVVGSCTIAVQSPGTLAASPTIDVLGSREAGGGAAVVTVQPNSLGCVGLPILDPLVCYGVSAPPPAAFISAPAGGGDTVGFASTYAVNGGPPIVGGTTTLIANGTHTLAVDLVASRSGGVFPAGNYQAQVTVRCE